MWFFSASWCKRSERSPPKPTFPPKLSSSSAFVCPQRRQKWGMAPPCAPEGWCPRRHADSPTMTAPRHRRQWLPVVDADFDVNDTKHSLSPLEKEKRSRPCYIYAFTDPSPAVLSRERDVAREKPEIEIIWFPGIYSVHPSELHAPGPESSDSRAHVS